MFSLESDLRMKTYQKYLNSTPRKQQYLPHHLPDKGFKATVVDRALTSLHWGTLEMTLTVNSKIEDYLRALFFNK